VLYFSAYEEIVWRLRSSPGGEQQWYHPLTAGASARLVSSTVTAPFEFLRTRQAAATGAGATQTGGMWHEFRSIVRNEGASTLYRGLRPTLWRDVPFSAIYWLSVEECRALWNRVYTHTLSPIEQAGQAFVNGAVSGMIAAACTTPFDVIKTRQQASVQWSATESTAATAASCAELNVELACCKHDGAVVYEGVLPKQQRTATGTFHLLRDIAQTEGVAGLWRGNQARMLKVAPGCAIMISSYEFGKRILE